ncbi:MAG TPA: hypothetical protein VE954_06405 [Oligoflexus sp.]|nr:hypothetical protein [Oligoflexus sp.]
MPTPMKKINLDFSRYDGVDPHSETLSSKEERGALLVLSGGGYRYDRPWLYYLTNLHLEVGHSATCIGYKPDFISEPNKRPILRRAVTRLCTDWAQQTGQQKQTIAAFSYGNSILAEALNSGFTLSPNNLIISLSPQLQLDEVFQRLRKFPESTVFVIGEEDSCAPRDRVDTLRKDGYRIWMVPKADHGLDDPHSVRRSIDSIRGFFDWLRPLI